MNQTVFVLLILVLIASGCDGPRTSLPDPNAPGQSPVDESLKKAESGDKAAMLAYAKSQASTGDQVKAFGWFLKAAEAGEPDAMAEVAARYRDGVGVREEADLARNWEGRAAESGVAAAMYESAMRFGPVSRPGGSFRGDIDCASSSVAEVKLKLETRTTLLAKASAGGHEAAQVALAKQLLNGVTCDGRWQYMKKYDVALLAPNPQAALAILEPIAQRGNVTARLVLATWLTVNARANSSYLNRATTNWTLLATETEPAKQNEIARWYAPVHSEVLYGYGEETDSGNIWGGKRLNVRQSMELSLQWYERASKFGYLPATLEAGLLLARLPKKSSLRDAQRAFGYNKRAADAGNFYAQLVVSWDLIDGTGTVKDWAQSAAWAKKAATHPTASLRKLANAHSGLATRYAKGQGVEQDPVVAYAWANVATSAGSESAKDVLTQLEKTLSAEQVTEAQLLSAQWTPGQLIERAGAASGPAGASGPGTVAGAGKVVSQGTGFFVSATGDIVTNSHVVKNCAEVRIPAMSTTGRVVVADTANDLAIVRAAVKSERVAKISAPEKVQQGQEIIVFGFPLDGFLPSSGNVTTGLVSALAGPGNNSSLIQITAPVQAGNSGGPVLDRHGNVAGVVVAKVDALRIAKITGDLAQNINFAVSVATLRSFLETNRVEYRSPSFFAFENDIAKVADAARDFTVKLECVR